MVGIIAVLWIIQAGKSYEMIARSRQSLYFNYNESICLKLDEYKESEIYYILDENYDKYGTYAKHLQYLIPNRPVHVISYKEYNNGIFHEGDIVLSDHKNELKVDMELLMETSFLDLYIK